MPTSALAASSAFTPALRQAVGPALQDLLAAEALYGAGLRRGSRVLLADGREESLARQLDAIVGPTGLVACGDDGDNPPAAASDTRRSFDIVFDRSTGAGDSRLAARLRALAQRLRQGGVLMLQQPLGADEDDDVFETGFDRLHPCDDAGRCSGSNQAAASDTADRLAALRISRAMRCAGLTSVRWRAADSFGRHVRRLLDEAADAAEEPVVVPVTVWAQR